MTYNKIFKLEQLKFSQGKILLSKHLPILQEINIIQHFTFSSVTSPLLL